MANSLGALIVRLGLDAAEYTRGLTKAEYQAQQFARNTRRAILDVGAALGSLAIGQQLIESTKAIISEAAALNDLSDATGSSVESLSKLNNQAKIAGTDFATMQNALLKLSAGMAGADEEATKTKKALQILGITTKDPVQALQEAAIKLSAYADGVNKVGLAVALFGKQGGQFVATLKDIAQLQDVGATVTKKQAEEAEKLEQSYRRLNYESRGFANLLLKEIVPALNAVIELMNVGAKAAGSFGQGLNAALSVALRPGSAADQLGTIDASLKRLKDEGRALDELTERRRKFAESRGLPTRGFEQDKEFGIVKGLREETIASLEAQRALVLVARQQRAVANAKFSPDDFNARDRLLLRQPQAPNPPGKEVKEAKEKRSEAERYLETLEQTLARTQELTTVEQVIREIQVGRLKDASHLEKDRALGFAQQIDAFKALEKELEASKKAWDDETRAVLDNVKAHADAANNILDQADQAKKTNAQLRDEIAIITSGEGAREALAKDYADAAIENAELAKQTRIAEGATLKEIEAFDDLIDQLVEYRELLDGKSLAEQMQKDAKAIQDVKDAFSDAVAEPLADFISGTKTAKEAFKSFVDDVSRQIARLAAQNIANALFGGTNSGGPDYFGMLAKLGLSLFGGGSYTSFGAGAGAGGIGFSAAAMGTSYSRGGWTMVGERGPELLNLPRGSSVTPNHSLASVGGGTVINQTINVLPGASRQTGYQAAREAGRQVSGAVRR